MSDTGNEKPAACRSAGQSPLALLDLPDAERSVVVWLMRHGEASLEEVMHQSGQAEPECRALLNVLLTKGLVEQAGDGAQARYRSQMGAKRGRRIPDEL